MHRLVLLLVLFAAACRPQEPPARAAPPDLLSTGTWVDLSHDFSSETLYWPTAKPFALEVVSAETTPAGFYYAANNFSTSEHGGTHLDAPIHFAEGRHTADQVPLDRLVGPAVVVDVVGEGGGRHGLPAGPGRARGVGAEPRPDPQRHDRARPHRMVDPLARQGALPRHDQDRSRRRGGAPLPRHRLVRRPLAGDRAAGKGRGDRHAQHRLRAVPDVRHPPDPPGPEHSGVRERDEPRAPACDAAHSWWHCR